MKPKRTLYTTPTAYGRPGDKIHWATAWAQPVFPGRRRLVPVRPIGPVLDCVDTGNGICVYDALMPDAFPGRMAYALEKVAYLANPGITVVEGVKVRSVNELAVCQQAFLGRGAEATWLRHGAHGYEAGPSSRLLVVDTFLRGEFEVVDFKLGRGQWAGVPVLVCETPAGGHFDVLAPGSTDAARAALLPGLHSVKGRAVVVRYKAWAAGDEAPVLPVATGWVE